MEQLETIPSFKQHNQHEELGRRKMNQKQPPILTAFTRLEAFSEQLETVMEKSFGALPLEQHWAAEPNDEPHRINERHDNTAPERRA